MYIYVYCIRVYICHVTTLPSAALACILPSRQGGYLISLLMQSRLLVVQRVLGKSLFAATAQNWCRKETADFFCLSVTQINVWINTVVP